MAQGQQGPIDDAPETLPANFFDSQKSAPETLPGDFFEKKQSSSPDNLTRQTNTAARAAGENQRATMPILPKPEPTGPVSRFLSGAMDAAKAFKPSLPDRTDIALSGAGPLPSMARHALQSYKNARTAGQPRGESAAEGAAGLVGVNAPGVRERAQRGDIAGVAGEAAPAIAATLLGEHAAKAVGAAREAIRPVQQAAAESVVAPLTFEGGGESGADVRAGINANRGLASEKGMTGSKRALAGTPEQPGKIGNRVSELKASANQILENHPNGNRLVDAGQHIDAAIDNAINNAEKIAGSTERLEGLRTALRTKYGAIRGTPKEMNDLASQIQGGASDLGAFKNTQPIEASAASAMRDAARRIRNNVNELVPDVTQINQRMADLLDAKSGVTHNLNAERGQSIFGNDRSGFWSSALNKTLGSAPVRTRLASIINAGNKLEIPEAMPPRQPLQPAELNRQLPAAPLTTPPPPDRSGPVNLGQPEIHPLAENRQLPAVGRTTGPRNVMPPGQFPISLPETTPRPLVGPERQLPQNASPTQPEVPLNRNKVWQKPPNIELPPSSMPPAQTTAPTPPAPKQPPTNGVIKAAKEAMAQEPAKPQESIWQKPTADFGKKAIQAARETPTVNMTDNEVKHAESGFTPSDEAATKGKREPREQLQKFDPETLQEAKDAVETAHDMWRQFERPGRYVVDTSDEANYGSDMTRPENSVYSIQSARPHIEQAHPWLKNLPKMTPQKLRAAVEAGRGVEYTRLLNEAGKHIQAVKEANAPVVEEFRDQLESAAKSVESIDPHLAQTLRGIIEGKYSSWSDLSSYAKDKLNEADAATAFDKAIADATAENSPEGGEEPGTESPQASQSDQQTQKLEGVLPGMENAVAENKAAAGKLQGEKMTEAMRAAGKNISAAAGEMETKSPLFRGSAASPQNEMFSPGGAAPKAPTIEEEKQAAREAKFAGWSSEAKEFDRQAHDTREAVRNQVSPNQYAKYVKQEEMLPRSASDRAKFWKRVFENL